jgi:hypothetical protein
MSSFIPLKENENVHKHTIKRHTLSGLLEILLIAALTSTLVCVKPLPAEAQSGRFLDVFTQKGGQGLNQSSDMFEPQELMCLYALVTYNDNPVANKLVGFQADGPLNAFENLTAGGSSSTNGSGIAEFSFRIPWPSTNPEEKVFGEWNVVATVNVADMEIMDTLTFQVGWIVRITSIATLDAAYNPEVEFLKQSTIVFDLTVENSANATKSATITIDSEDSAGYPIIHLQLDSLVLQPGLNQVNASSNIPNDAKTGQATASAAAYTAPIESGGVLYSPAISTTFQIVASPSLTYPVTFAQTGLDSSAAGTVVTVNGTSKGFADLPFTLWVDNGSSLTYTYSNPSSSTIDKVFILTDITGPSSPINVTGSITVTGHYAVQFTFPTIPFWVILTLLGALALVASIVLLVFFEVSKRLRKKKSFRRSYVIISHPHV